MKKIPFKDRPLLLLAFFVILLVFGALVFRKYQVAPPPDKAPAAVPQEPRELREVLLYFGAENGRYLTAETREIEDCLDEADCIGATVQALIDGPVGDLVPILPAHATLRHVEEQDGTATVDFSQELVTGHPGGSFSELLAVYGLANTLAENFPHIRHVRILVEGAPVETLKGHVDLRGPVQADFSFSRLPEGAEKEKGKAGADGEMSQPVALPGRTEQ